jgi:hypothetical protein
MFGRNFDPFNQQPKNNGPVAGRRVDKTAKDAARKKRSEVLRYMFNPEFGENLKSMHETHSYFVKFLAALFLQTGLIDAGYPGFADPRQMKLVTMIRSAYRGLRYTREGLPQVLLFYAFAGSFVSVMLALLLFVATVTTPPAQTPMANETPPAIEAPVR